MTGVMRAVVWLIRIGIGLVLIYSGLLKVTHPYEFLNSVFGYHILGPRSATLVAAVLPLLEVALGVALMCGICTTGASFISAVLFVLFTIGQASILIRGVSADCGCFGAGEPVSWVSLLRTAALLAGALLCLLWARQRPGEPAPAIPACSGASLLTLRRKGIHLTNT